MTDPELPGEAAETIRRAAAADLPGGRRLRPRPEWTFFVKEDGQVVFNEINTMPGFTAISMYPMLWEARGIAKEQLVERLICHGMQRFQAL